MVYTDPISFYTDPHSIYTDPTLIIQKQHFIYCTHFSFLKLRPLCLDYFLLREKLGCVFDAMFGLVKIEDVKHIVASVKDYLAGSARNISSALPLAVSPKRTRDKSVLTGIFPRCPMATPTVSDSTEDICHSLYGILTEALRGLVPGRHVRLPLFVWRGTWSPRRPFAICPNKHGLLSVSL